MVHRTPPLRVRVVADDPLVRDALAAALANSAGLELVDTGIRTDGGDTDATLWDLGPYPEQRLGELRESANGSQRVVALVPDAAGVTAALLAGASGVLLRSTDTDLMAAGLAAAARGLTVLDEGARDAFLSAPGEDDLGFPLQPLTTRELEVLRLLARGWTNRAIGSELGISEHTVKFHVNAILEKLGADGRTEAVVRAARIGLIAL